MRHTAVFDSLQNNKRLHTDFQTVPGVLTPDECARVARMADEIPAQRSHIMWGDAHENSRRTDLHWLYPDATNQWLFDKIVDAVRAMNNSVFQFDLDGTVGAFQIGRYGPSQGYDWHCDFGPQSPRRKLSVSVQLTAADDYTGADLEFFRAGHANATASRRQGDMSIFPSWATHRVTKLTRGERLSLVTWLEGTPFR